MNVKQPVIKKKIVRKTKAKKNVESIIESGEIQAKSDYTPLFILGAIVIVVIVLMFV